MHLWRAMLALSLILPACFAAGSDFTLFVPAVAMVVIVLLAAANMLATAISNPQLEAWAKTELRELVAGVVLIAIIVMFFVSSQGVSIAIIGKADYIQESRDITSAWSDGLMEAYEDVIEAAMRIRAAATYSSGTSIAIYMISFTYQTGPLGGASIFLVPLSLATQGLTNAIYLTESVRLLLSFCSVVVPKMLLPISFCARLIPFTRKLGNTLIALSLALIVFLPLSVILADTLNKEIGVPQPSISDMGELDSNPFPLYVFGPLCEAKVFRILFSMTDPLFAAIVCLPLAWIPGAFPACFQLMWQTVYPIMSMIFQYLNALLLIAWEAAINPTSYGTDVYDQLQPFLTDVSNLVMVIYLDIVLIGIVTISGARSISAVLGGEWYMAGVQRLI